MTLPATPLSPYDHVLSEKYQLLLALCWLKDGDVVEFMKLDDLSESTLTSMILEEARKVNYKRLLPL